MTDIAFLPVDRKRRLEQVVANLRARTPVSDGDFDCVYPPSARHVSATFWTPMEVIQRVVQLLEVSPTTRVLDIGSGVGKFCIVGAALTGAAFVGVEHREEFVRIARDTSDLAGTCATFVHGNFDVVNIRAFDVIYLFNPFEENLWPLEERFDASIKLSHAKFDQDVRRAESLLDRARRGTRVVTYHGFGGTIPAEYHLLHSEGVHTGDLDVWLKTRTSFASSFGD